MIQVCLIVRTKILPSILISKVSGLLLFFHCLVCSLIPFVLHNGITDSFVVRFRVFSIVGLNQSFVCHIETYLISELSPNLI